MLESIIEVRLPSSLLKFDLNRQQVEQRIIEWLVLSLFIEERISSAKAARLLGISRIEFLSLLKAKGIAFINYTEDDLIEEFDAVASLSLQLEQDKSERP